MIELTTQLECRFVDLIELSMFSFAGTCMGVVAHPHLIEEDFLFTTTPLTCLFILFTNLFTNSYCVNFLSYSRTRIV